VRFVSARDGTVSEVVKIDLGDYAGRLDRLLSRVDDTRVLCRLTRYTSSGYHEDVGLLDTATMRVSVIVENSGSAGLGPDGALLFTRGSTLYGAAFDLERAEVGSPVQLVAGLRTLGPYVDAAFDVARDGTLAFLPGGEQGVDRRLVYLLPDGSTTPLPLEPRPYSEAVAVSPDESRLAVVVTSPAKLYEIWGSELDSPRIRRIRSVSRSDLNYPVFAPDNDTVVYMRAEADEVGIEAASFDGHFEPYWVVEPGDGLILPQAVHPVRSTVLYLWERPEGVRLYAAPLEKGSRPVALFNDTSNRVGADYCSDGSVLAYLSDETERDEIYVCAVRADGSLGRPVAVTTDGARGFAWLGPRAAGGTHDLAVMTNEGAFSFPITPGERPRVGPAVPLGYDRRNTVGLFDHLSGGRRLAIVRGENESPATHVEVILNWYDTASRTIRGK
jgi:hypothetical protein